MAALSDKDLRAILGDDYVAQLAAAHEASGLTDGVREARKQHKALEDKKFSGVSAVTIGIALLAAGLYTQDPGFWIQATVGVIFAVMGAVWIFYIRSQQQALVTI
jgi:hypothetical protein